MGESDSESTHAGMAGSGTEADGSKTAEAGPAATQARRRRPRRRPFPALTFEEALTLGLAIQKYAAGNRVRRLTLFDNMGRSAEGGTARNLVTASGQYGITTGAYNAEYLELTPDGSLATVEGVPREDQVKARFRLAIENNTWFSHLYEQLKGNRLPDKSVMRDSLLEKGLEPEYVQECVDTFMVNASFLNLLRTVAGAERLVTLDFLLDDYAQEPSKTVTKTPAEMPAVFVPSEPKRAEASEERSVTQRPRAAVGTKESDNACFYITPIGGPDSEQRLHADLFMGSLVEPALQEIGLRLVRADQIGEAGLITAQVIEYIVRSPLVVADLSFHNPNVFYELALRHAVRRPIVQLIRSADRVPFDLQPFRTIVIDTTSIYTLVPKLETYRAEIASQMRMAMESAPGETDNPLTAFYPEFWSSLAIAKG